MSVSRTVVLTKAIVKCPGDANFEIREENLNQELKDGQVLIETHYYSPDPFIPAAFGNKNWEGKPLSGFISGKILSSKNDKYSDGQFVMGLLHAATHIVTDVPFVSCVPHCSSLYVVEPSDKLKLQNFVGVLGMPGLTALLGLRHLLDIKKGCTLVVTSAAGAVGSLISQFAKKQGAGKIIGIAGSKEKCDRLINKYQYDVAVNYKSPNYEKELAEACADGVDRYWDGVGGKTSEMVLGHMKEGGLVVVCGSISNYCPTEEEAKEAKESDNRIENLVKDKKLAKTRMTVFNYMNEWPQGIKELGRMVSEGELTFDESMEEGIENVPKAYRDLFEGKNVGKQLVRLK